MACGAGMVCAPRRGVACAALQTEGTGMSRQGGFSSIARAFMGAGRPRRADPAPWTPLRKPLSECTLAIVTSSAYVDVDPQLDRAGVELCTFRALSGEPPACAPATSEAGQTSLHAKGDPDFEADRLAVAVGRARELVTAGGIARLAPRHLMLTGAVDSRNRLLREARAAARLLIDDQADVVLLVPM